MPIRFFIETAFLPPTSMPRNKVMRRSCQGPIQTADNGCQCSGPSMASWITGHRRGDSPQSTARLTARGRETADRIVSGAAGAAPGSRPRRCRRAPRGRPRHRTSSRAPTRKRDPGPRPRCPRPQDLADHLQPHLTPMPAQHRIVVRPGAVPRRERRADPVQHPERPFRQLRLVQAGVDLGRRPARKRAARGRRLEGARHPPVDRQSRPPPARPARPPPDPAPPPTPRGSPTPRTAPAWPAARPSCDRPPAPRPGSRPPRPIIAFGPGRRARRGCTYTGLVSLQDTPRGAVLVALHQIHRPVAHDGRPAFGGNPVHQRRQPARRLLVIRGGRLGDPGYLGGRVPELQAAFPCVDLAPRHAPARAPGERARRQRRLRCRGRRRAGVRNVRPGLEISHVSILQPKRRGGGPRSRSHR